MLCLFSQIIQLVLFIPQIESQPSVHYSLFGCSHDLLNIHYPYSIFHIVTDLFMKKISMKGRTHTHQAKAHTSVRQSIVCQEPNEQLKVKWPQYLRSSQQHHPYNFVADQKIAAPSARCSSRALCLSQLMEIPDFPNRKAF